jgi:predicted nucleic-acid-binding Zn-ribbon protein
MEVIIKCSKCRTVTRVSITPYFISGVPYLFNNLPVSAEGSCCPKCGTTIELQPTLVVGAAGAKVVKVNN